MRMMTCKGELTITVTGSGQKEELWPGKPVDLDRVLREAAPARPAKGVEGQDGYEPAVPAVARHTVAEAVAGLEHLFEPMAAAEPAKAPPATPAKE